MAQKREKCRTDSLYIQRSKVKFVLLTLIYTTYNQLRAKGLTKCVRYTEVSFFEFLFFIFFAVTGLKNIVIPSTLLHGGSLYRGSTVHMPTLPPSRLHHFEYLYPQFTLSIDISAFVSWGRGGGQDKPNAAISTQICIYHRRPCSHVKQTKNPLLDKITVSNVSVF